MSAGGRNVAAHSRRQVEWLEAIAEADPRVRVVGSTAEGDPVVRWASGEEGVVGRDGRHRWSDVADVAGPTCPAHPGVPEPCPTCESYIAAGL